MGDSLRPPKPMSCAGDACNNWLDWIRTFRFYATATELEKKDKKIQAAIFMTAIGQEAGKVFESFQLKEEEITYEILVKKFDEHFKPKINSTYERFVFNNLSQSVGEKFEDFLTRIRLQFLKCNYEKITVEDILKDRLILGICKDDIREKLINDDTKTLNEVINICKAHEVASLQMQAVKVEKEINLIKTRNKNENVSNKNDNNNSSIKIFFCKRCKTKHGAKSCPAYGVICSKCNCKNHLPVACRAKFKSDKTKNQKIDNLNESVDLYIDSLNVGCPGDGWYESVRINDAIIKFKLDTGAECNVLPKHIVDRLHLKIDKTVTKNLITYSGHRITVLGELLVRCGIKNINTEIVFKVIDSNATPILGKRTCQELNLIQRPNGQNIDYITIDETIYNGLGCLKNFEYDIDLIDNPSFEIYPPRRIAHSIRDQVKNEIDKMEKMEVIKKIMEPTPAVSPMVVVRQKNRIRICLDPSNVNKNILRRHHPLQTIEEISSRINKSKIFTLLDCKKGFWQVRVSERTQKYLAFATPWGRYTCLRMPFGLASAPEIFQHIMNGLLGNIPNVECSMDDILIHAETEEKCSEVTKRVLDIIGKAGLKLNKEKCLFNKKSLKFLGHVISENGLEMDKDKISTIFNIETPTTAKQVQRLLGMVTYVSKFIPNCSKLTAPMRDLIKKDTTFVWDAEQERAFVEIKKALTTAPVLKFYDTKKDVKLSVDASKTALGAVLLQDEHPIAYASRSLTSAEFNYPQIEKEATAIRFACKKFHEYIYGKQVTIESDHKPLETIFKKPITSAPPRLQRILFDVMVYSPKVIYKKGTEIPIADALSRDVKNRINEAEEEDLQIHIVMPFSANALVELVEDTKNDPDLRILKNYIMTGWPEEKLILQSLKHFSTFKDELAVYDEIIYKGEKIVIPTKQISKILKIAHIGHIGIQSSIRLVRQSFYWKNLASDIEELVSKCSVCQQTQRNNVKEVITTKLVPDLPFQIVGSDLFTFNSESYLLIVDSYSGYIDFEKLNDTHSIQIINQLQKWFSVHGTPEILETDNGPQYSSYEFKKFAEEWNFRHQTSSPRFPRSNGLAERGVQTAKLLLKKCFKDGTNIYLALQNWRNTPRSDELGSPNSRLFSRRTRTILPIKRDQLKPKIITKVQENLQTLRDKQKQYADRGAKVAIPLNTNDKVRLQIGPREWTAGTIVRNADAPKSVYVKTDYDKILRRNTHQLAKTSACLHPKRKSFIPSVPSSERRELNDAVEHSRHSPEGKSQSDETVENNINNTIKTSSYGRQIKPIQKLNL